MFDSSNKLANPRRPGAFLVLLSNQRSAKTRIGVAGPVLRVVNGERPTSLTANLGSWHAWPMGIHATVHAGARNLTVTPRVGADNSPDAVTDSGRQLTCGAQVSACAHEDGARLVAVGMQTWAFCALGTRRGRWWRNRLPHI